MNPQQPHAGQPVLRRGPATAQARTAVLLVPGRGDSASGILPLADQLERPDVTTMWSASADLPAVTAMSIQWRSRRSRRRPAFRSDAATAVCSPRSS